MAALATLTIARSAAADNCTASGDVTVQVDEDVSPGAKLVNGVTKVYDSGYWAFDGTGPDGKGSVHVHSCFKQQGMDALKDVKNAPWKVTHLKTPNCTRGDNWQVIRVHGKSEFTRQGCDNTLDDKSLIAMNQLLKLLQEDRAVAESQH